MSSFSRFLLLNVVPMVLQMLLLAAGGGSQVLGADLSQLQSLYVDLSAKPDPRSLAAFDVNVLHPRAEVEMEAGHALGSRYIALLDVTAYQTGTSEALLAAQRRLPSTPSQTSTARTVAMTDERWVAWVVEGMVEPAVKRGFDGFALMLGGKVLSKEERYALLTLTATLKQRYADKTLLLDLRSELEERVEKLADGFLALGIFTSRGPSGQVEWTPIAEAQKLTRQVRVMQMRGLRTFAVDYAEAGDRAEAKQAVQRLQEIGATPFVTSSALSGVNLGPWEEVARRVVVLHGWDESLTGQKAPAAEGTVSARVLKPVLEWLGCTPEFCIAQGTDFMPSMAGLRAVVLDSSLLLSPQQQQSLAARLPELKAAGVPVLLTGMPFTDAAARHSAMQHLGLSGQGSPVARLAKTSVARMDSSLMESGARTLTGAFGFLDLQAPATARVVLSLRGMGALGAERRFDKAFLADWGGAWIEPAVDASGPQVNLGAFLAAWLGGAEPTLVPDTTTREGRRVFYSVIDSTGFASPSTLPGLPLCSEVMRDRVFDRYLLPFTVSVCEAEVRGWFPGQGPREAKYLQQVARSIYSLVQVQAASGSMSRPESWQAGSDISAKLNAQAEGQRRDMEREIAGSMAFIHRHLLPAGKNVGLMLWPQESTPSAAALSFCSYLGVGQLASGKQGILSADAVVEKEARRPRFTPVALRCSFNDVRTSQGLQQIETVLTAASREPLHAVTASAYVASVQDAAYTRVLRAAADRWIVLNEGRCRTLRLPASAGVPDMRRSLGVSGYKVRHDQLYIHTMGNQRTEVVLTQQPQPRHLHLLESSAVVDFMELSSQRATFQTRDLRPIQIQIGGFEPNGQCAYTENNRPYTAKADAQGVVSLEIVCRALVTLQALPAAVSTAMR